MAVHAYDFCSQISEAGRHPWICLVFTQWVPDQPGLYYKTLILKKKKGKNTQICILCVWSLLACCCSLWFSSCPPVWPLPPYPEMKTPKWSYDWYARSCSSCLTSLTLCPCSWEMDASAIKMIVNVFQLAGKQCCWQCSSMIGHLPNLLTALSLISVTIREGLVIARKARWLRGYGHLPAGLTTWVPYTW